MLEIGTETFAGTFPFAPHSLDLGHFRMHYVDEGAGDPVVLRHGDPTWGYLYRSFIPRLAERDRCIVPDHMGMGKSGVPGDPFPYRLQHHVANLERLLLTLDLSEITLVLHDWGGPVGLGFAVRHAARIKRLIFFPIFFQVPAVICLMFWALSQLISGTIAGLAPGDVGGVAWWAHVGGFVAGLLLCRLFLLPRRSAPRPFARDELGIEGAWSR
jgi:pimeloyl-ACP methyl ester carboxylesterase